jgi:hypothetical protein
VKHVSWWKKPIGISLREKTPEERKPSEVICHTAYLLWFCDSQVPHRTNAYSFDKYLNDRHRSTRVSKNALSSFACRAWSPMQRDGFDYRITS